jgi:multidrug resistance efflux pump
MIRANNAERRLANAQNQLAAAEEKMAAMNQKTTAADTKWEARVKEYETRLRAAEEKVKRERQGYKERVVELENQIRCVNIIFLSPAGPGDKIMAPQKAFCSDYSSTFFLFLPKVTTETKGTR